MRLSELASEEGQICFLGKEFYTFIWRKARKPGPSLGLNLALVAAAEAFLGGVTGMASAVVLYHNAVQLAVCPFVIVGAAAHVAADGLAADLRFAHISLPPPVIGLVSERTGRRIPIKSLGKRNVFPFFSRGRGRSPVYQK